jgi:hypothetical protein
MFEILQFDETPSQAIVVPVVVVLPDENSQNLYLVCRGRFAAECERLKRYLVPANLSRWQITGGLVLIILNHELAGFLRGALWT